MSAARSPVVVLRGASGTALGHVAVGNGVAGLVQQRAAGDAGLSYTAAVLGSGDAVHGGNAAGLVCAALGDAAHGLVRRVLESAHGVDEARAVLADAQSPVSLLVADADGALILDVAPGGGTVVAARQVEAGDGPGSVESLLARLRALEPAPREGAVPAAALAALLTPGEPPRLWSALGPPGCAVFIRHWPGMELVAEESAGPEGAPLARLAVAVAQATSTDSGLRRHARKRLDRAEAEALREGEAAEAMAARMDADTDDRGAAVRRLVAQAHAVELARRALEELAVPAPPGSLPGPRL
jgi:hypothetical protein